MKYFLSLLFLSLPLFSANLVSYNIYDREDRVDIMLSFDSAYEASVKKDVKKGFILLSFDSLKSKKEEAKELNSKLVKKVLISPQNTKTAIMLETKDDVDIDLSSVNDKFGLRVRVLPKGVTLANTTPLSLMETNSSIQTKASSLEGFDLANYALVLTILLGILFALWWLKRSFLLKNNINTKKFRIVFQRPIDRSNQFIILEYEKKRYTMIIGNSNLVLEKQDIDEKDLDTSLNKKDRNFDSFFEENKRKIQNLLSKRTNN